MRKSAALIGMLGVVVACGGGAPAPVAPEPVAPEPAPVASNKTERPPEPEPPTPVSPPPEREVKAEECESPWVCVSVPPKSTKSEKRATKLLGDPKIDQTWSKNVDSSRAGVFEFGPGRTFEVVLKSMPGDTSQLILKSKGQPDVILDTHKGADFLYVGVIAADKDSTVMFDFRYLK